MKDNIRPIEDKVLSKHSFESGDDQQVYNKLVDLSFSFTHKIFSVKNPDHSNLYNNIIIQYCNTTNFDRIVASDSETTKKFAKFFIDEIHINLNKICDREDSVYKISDELRNILYRMGCYEENAEVLHQEYNDFQVIMGVILGLNVRRSRTEVKHILTKSLDLVFLRIESESINDSAKLRDLIINTVIRCEKLLFELAKYCVFFMRAITQSIDIQYGRDPGTTEQQIKSNVIRDYNENYDALPMSEYQHGIACDILRVHNPNDETLSYTSYVYLLASLICIGYHYVGVHISDSICESAQSINFKCERVTNSKNYKLHHLNFVNKLVCSNDYLYQIPNDWSKCFNIISEYIDECCNAIKQQNRDATRLREYCEKTLTTYTKLFDTIIKIPTNQAIITATRQKINNLKQSKPHVIDIPEIFIDIKNKNMRPKNDITIKQLNADHYPIKTVLDEFVL